MLSSLRSIQSNRLVLALMLTFLLADTYPHPSLGPGLVETLIAQARQASVISYR